MFYLLGTRYVLCWKDLQFRRDLDDVNHWKLSITLRNCKMHKDDPKTNATYNLKTKRLPENFWIDIATLLLVHGMRLGAIKDLRPEYVNIKIEPEWRDKPVFYALKRIVLIQGILFQS